MKCPNCGNLNENNRFCTQCGQPVLLKMPHLSKNLLKFKVDFGKENLRPRIYQDAISSYKNKDYKKAESCFAELLVKYPKEAAYHNFLGAIYLKKGKYNLGQLHFLKALELDPLLWEGFYNLGIIYSLQTKYDLAKVYFKRAYELNHKNYKCLYNIGTISLKQGKLTEAISNFLLVEKMVPDYEANRVNLELAKRKLKELMERQRHERNPSKDC